MIWVIGKDGMLGSEVCRQLEKNNIPFIASSLEVDITKIEAIENFILQQEKKSYLVAGSKNHANAKIKWIINCAAYTAVEKAEEEIEKATAINTLGSQNIAHAARNNGIKLIHISTDYVFGGKGSTPFTEDMQKNPLGVYGKTKSDGEDAIIQGMTQYYIIRTSWLYGYSRPNFVYTMVKLMNSKDEIKVVNDQFGTPTFTADLASTIIKIIEKTDKNTSDFKAKDIIPYGIYNFSDMGQTTWFDFAVKINELGKKYKRITNECTIKPCSTEEYAAKVERPAYSVLSKEKIIRELKIKIPSWEKSLEVFMKNRNF